MYNRYIPGSNGIYRRQTVPEHCDVVQETEEKLPAEAVQEIKETRCGTASSDTPQSCSRPNIFGNLDLGDLLLLCIILLLLIESDGEDMMSVLITAAAFVLLQ